MRNHSKFGQLKRFTSFIIYGLFFNQKETSILLNDYRARFKLVRNDEAANRSEILSKVTVMMSLQFWYKVPSKQE